MTFTAMLLSGHDPFTAAFIAGTNMGFDFSPGSQLQENSNWHSMAKPLQSAACAKIGAKSFINSKLATGNSIDLGAALHTNEDSFASGHAYKVWDGHLTWEHVKGDWLPSFDEVVNAISSDMDLLLANKASNDGTGANSSCGCQ